MPEGRGVQTSLALSGGSQTLARDIAWVLVAADDVHAHGGVLDEARVNRLRYLEGTPKGSTRWIDTGWALVVVSRAGDARDGS